VLFVGSYTLLSHPLSIYYNTSSQHRLAKEEKAAKYFDRVFLCANVGDCKAFRITPSTMSVIEITEPSLDGRDVQNAGGHLGW